MVQSVLYDGTFEGFLCAVFDVFYYKYTEVDICTEKAFGGNIFEKVHKVHTIKAHQDRLWKGLGSKLTKEAQGQLYKTFLSELPGIENSLLSYIQYLYSTEQCIEKDFSHPAVLTITQTAKKVWREKHRMEAFVRFQKTGDHLFYAIIEPDYNVLPLISDHFKNRYADQRWLIYDGKRNYGIYYNLAEVNDIQLNFSEATGAGKDVSAIYNESEEMYQQLWQQYFKSVNIAARKNTKLHIQHMPRRYWKYMPEKKTGLHLK